VKIPAYLMRVSDRDENFFQPYIPMFSQLTSEIAIVPMADRQRGFSLIPVSVFVLSGCWHGSTMEPKEFVRPQAVRNWSPHRMPTTKTRSARGSPGSRLQQDGSAHGRIMVAWAGEEGLVHRLSGFKTDAEGRKKELENEIQTMLPNGTTVQLDSVTAGTNRKSQLTASFTVEIPSFASSAGRRMLVPTNLFQSQNVQPFAHGERKKPRVF